MVDESGKWNERQRAYPGRSDDTSIKLINRFGKKKRLNHQKSAEAIVSGKKKTEKG